MNCFIKKILLFGNNEIREVSFKQGLNIITGASQTGKSALIEIVDYCFCSKFSAIPKGKIYDWTDLYSLVIENDGNYLVIGRRRFENKGDYNMYLTIESDTNFLNNISISYFNNQDSQKLNSVKKQIAQFFRITVKNTNETFQTRNIEGHTASIRNLTSFMFQHQNLIASKHSLFSRFDDPLRKKNTINQLPVFLGWVGDEYYSYIREKEILTEKKNRFEKLISKEKKLIEDQKKELDAHFKNYYSIIGKRFSSDYSVEELLILRKQLPDYNAKTFVNETLTTRYMERKEYRDRVKKKRDVVQKRITDIEIFNNYTSDYQINLLELRDKSKKGIKLKNEESSCPLCGNESDKVIIEELKKLSIAREDLNNELVKTKDFKEDYSSELQKLNIEKGLIDNELRKTNSQIKHLERQFKEIEHYKSTSERAIYAKAKLDFIIDNITNASILDDLEKELKEIIDELEILDSKLGDLNIENKLDLAEKQINLSIGKICSKLDFEDRFVPVEAKFDIRDFSFSVKDPLRGGEIRLGELGSGANWLASHLGVFLSLLELSAGENNSKLPSILFLDQPSQIYFPNEQTLKDIKKGNIEFEKVENVYNTVLDKIQSIKESYGFEPQVIITDHADNLKLKKGYDYERYLIKRWWPGQDEKALI